MARSNSGGLFERRGEEDEGGGGQEKLKLEGNVKNEGKVRRRRASVRGGRVEGGGRENILQKIG